MNPIYLLAWIPETLLNEKGSSEWDKFVKVEEQPNTEDDDGAYGCFISPFTQDLQLGLIFKISF